MSLHPPPPPPPPVNEDDAAGSESAKTHSRHCPYCLESIHVDAVRCSHCRTWLHGNPLQNEWYRSQTGRIGGVCQGLAEQFHVSATLLRLLFVLATIFGAGTGLVAYIALWVIMPLRPVKNSG